MPVRVDVVYSKTSNLDWSEEIACGSCGTRFKASVFSSATGSGSAPYGIGREAASDEAGVDAFQQASEEAQTLIRLRRCLRCKRSLGAVTGVKVATAIRTGVATLLLVGLLILPLGLLGPGGEKLGGLLCILGFPTGWYAMHRWQLNKRIDAAERRVRLEPLVANPRPATPAPRGRT